MKWIYLGIDWAYVIIPAVIYMIIDVIKWIIENYRKED